MSNNDGGPAYPQAQPFQDGNGNWHYPEQPGMSLRDWFAGQALAGAIRFWLKDSRAEDAEIANWSFEIADAMLAARNSTPTTGA